MPGRSQLLRCRSLLALTQKQLGMLLGSRPVRQRTRQNRSQYTIEALAKFLGETKDSTGKPHDGFISTFGALELISEGYLSESACRI